MRDFREAKAMAQTLREALNVRSISLTHSKSLELIAKILGCRDWNALAAKIAIQQRGQTGAPLLRMRRTDRQHPNTTKPHGRRLSVAAATLDDYVGLLWFNDNGRLHGHARRGSFAHAISDGTTRRSPFNAQSPTELFQRRYPRADHLPRG